MTFREKIAIEHPDKINEFSPGEVIGCPCQYGYEEKRYCDDFLYAKCNECWDREIPGTEPTTTTTPTITTNTTSAVDHPNHYNREGAMECIEEMITLFGKEAVKHFCLCNAWKYRYRQGNKEGVSATEDADKANWYIKKFKELCDESE